MNSYSLYKNIFVVLKVSPNFTNDCGEFVFGPLCPFKSYTIDVWVTSVKHIKICEICCHEGECLKGTDIECDCKYEEHEQN